MVLEAGDRGGVDYLHPFQGQVYDMVEQAPELSNPVPRFRRRNGNGKNPDGQGGRVEIFCEAKNTTRS